MFVRRRQNSELGDTHTASACPLPGVEMMQHGPSNTAYSQRRIKTECVKQQGDSKSSWCRAATNTKQPMNNKCKDTV